LIAAVKVREHVVMASEYVFVDEWDVDAPQEAVFDALADGRTYPDWWTPTYLEAETDGPPEPGRVARHRFKGKLPYVLETTTRLTCVDHPNRVEADVDGDLRGARCGRSHRAAAKCTFDSIFAYSPTGHFFDI
jgi:uncharacterized protein YndB with AHSA1/START domain